MKDKNKEELTKALDRAKEGLLTILMAQGATTEVEEYIACSKRLPTALSYPPSFAHTPFKIKNVRNWWLDIPSMPKPLSALLLPSRHLLSSTFSINFLEQPRKSRKEVINHCLASPLWSSLIDLSSPISFVCVDQNEKKSTHTDNLWNMAVSSYRSTYDSYIDFLSSLVEHNVHKLPKTPNSPLFPLASFIDHLRFWLQPSALVPQTQNPQTPAIDQVQALLSDFLIRAKQWGVKFDDDFEAYNSLIDLSYLLSRAPASKKIKLFQTLQKHGIGLQGCSKTAIENNPLFKAISQGEEEIAVYLCQNGASILHKCPHTNNTMALAGCASDKAFKTFKRLSQGQSFIPNINGQNIQGQTPLHQASQALSLKMVDHLLSLNADPNIKDNKKCFPHHLQSRGIKAQKQWQKITQSLKNAGAHDLNALDYLKQGCITLSPPLVAKALKMGADPSHVFDNGKTPLHTVLSVVRTNNLKKATPLFALQQQIVSLLLQHGAQVSDQDKEGNSPLHICVDRGLVEIADMLLSQGATNTIVNNQNLKPSEMFTTFVPFDHSTNVNQETAAAKKVFEVFCKHNVFLTEGDFLRLQADPSFRAVLLKQQIKQEMGAGSNPASQKRKM